MRPKRRNLRTSVEEFQHRSTGVTMHPTGVIDSYDGDGRGRVEGLSSSQPFDIYFYKSDDTAAAGLGNRMLQHDQHPGAPITRYTNLDIVTSEGVTLTGQVVVLLETLGTGTFADVYKAEYNGRIVAVKIPKASLHSAKQREAFNRELHALRKTADSKLTLDLIGYRPQPHYWLITSYMSEGTLNSRIKSAAGRPLPLREVLDVGIELSSAMQDLHAHHLMHRDLTPFNLLFHEGHLRLADFGVAVDLDRLGGPDALVPASPSLPSAAAHAPSPFFSPSSLVPASSTSPFAFAIPSFASPAAAPLPEHCYGGYFTSPAAAGEDAEYGDDMALDDERHHHHGDGDDLYAYDDDEYDYEYDYDDDGACVEMGDTGDDAANDVDVGATNNNDDDDDHHENYDLPLDMSPNGHPYYRAPEVNEGRAYSLAAEIYNFGSVLYECMTGTVLSAQAPHVAGVPAPTGGGHLVGGLRRSAERDRRGGGFPDELWRLQASCWDRDPAKRPSFAAICQRLTALRASLGPAAPTA